MSRTGEVGSMGSMGSGGFWWGMMDSKRGDVKLCFGVYKSIPANAGK